MDILNRRAIFREWTDEQFAAWLAGFFDGEGCVYLHPEKLSAIEVSVSNTERHVIEGIWQRTGWGDIIETTFSRENWKTKYSLRIRNYAQVEEFILTVRKYLVIKGPKADLAMERVATLKAQVDNIQERNETIRTLAKGGMRHIDIAEQFGVSRSLIGQICSKEGTIRKQGRRPGPRGRRTYAETDREKFPTVKVGTKTMHIDLPAAEETPDARLPH